jgi:hypothetical protein
MVRVLDLARHRQKSVALFELFDTKEAVDVMIVGLHRLSESGNRWQGSTKALHWLCRCPTNELDDLDGLPLCFIPNYYDSHAHSINSRLLFEMVKSPHIVL